MACPSFGECTVRIKFKSTDFKASVLRIIKEWIAIVDPKRNHGNKQNDAYFYDDEFKEQDSSYIYENECIENELNSNTDLECVSGQKVSKKASDLSKHKILVKKKVKKRVIFMKRKRTSSILYVILLPSPKVI